MELIDSISEAYDLSSGTETWQQGLLQHLQRHAVTKKRFKILRAHIESALLLREAIKRHEDCSRSLQHTPPPHATSPRAALRYIIEASERFRSTPRQQQSLIDEIWVGLYSGTWSIVDHHEHQGRRYFFLYRTDIGEQDPLRLTHLQRRTLTSLSQGHGDGEIAGALGIKLDAASALVRSVRRKLRVPLRRDLIGLNAQCLRAIHLRSESISCALLYSSTALSEVLPASISDAERSILRLQVEGKSNNEIAQIRRVAYKTVSNQVATAYSKLNVRTCGEMLHNLRVACR